ncbi:MAG: glycoside hydrolase family 3 C-terminal domain-containing protein, partial [Bacilli bacterium]|nr:glycoside hydrolase family 3 C-terminal domain-containing protein [Bacilli bacterium]
NNCRLKLDLPNNQDLLVEFLEKINIPLVAVISAGRPLLIAELEKKVDAILWNFHLGVEAGNSLAACLLGEVNPSGKITLSFPKEFGQIPIYYNRYPYGRPDIVHYLDGDLEPLYPFGYGLSYSKFNFENVEISFQAGFIKVTLEIENVSEIDGKEVVQIYLVPDLMNKLLPEKQLIAFKKIEVKAKSKVKLELETKIDLGNYRRGVSIMVGISSLAGITKYFSFD